MRPQSFEHYLRHAVPPTPEPEARLRARRAALAEFERARAQVSNANVPAHTGIRGILHRLRFLRGDQRQASVRRVWVGGLASACVAVVAVSVFWLIPPEQREARFGSKGSSVNVLPPILSAPQEPLRSTPDTRRLLPQAGNKQPAELQHQKALAPVGHGKLPHEVRVPQMRPLPEISLPEISLPQFSPPRTREVPLLELLPEATSPQSASSPTRSPQLAPSPVAPAQAAPREVASAQASAPHPEQEDKIALAEAAVVEEPAPAEPGNTNTAAPVTARNSPGSSATTGAAVELNEIVVTRAKRSSWLNGLFSPNAPQTQPALMLPPQERRNSFEHFDVNPVKRVAEEPVSTFSADVDTASYSFVRRQLNEGVLPQVDAVRVEEMINYFDYAWPAAESREQPFKPTVTVSDSPWGKGKKLIHIGIKGYELPVRQQPEVNLVLLLDVSGSMDEPDKLPLAQQSMALLLDTLKPTDTVAIVVYAGSAGEVLSPTPVRDKQTILRALQSLQPGGSTAGAQGIRLAYELAERNFRKDGVNRILLATDGDFNVGITDRNELKGFVERERDKGVYLSVLGFGEDNYRDDMAQTLAQNGNGVAAYIDTLNEARKVLVQESTAALFTIARDVKLQVEFNPATVAEYRLVGYEKRRLNREDFNNDKVDAGDVGSGHTVTAIYEITPVGSRARLIDERRYQNSDQARSDPQQQSREYGFLKIRYKLPTESESRLLEQAIPVDAGVPEPFKRDVEFCTAVAGFGQLLKGGKYTGPLTFRDVLRQASGAVGEDPYGYRTELVQLVKKAERARGL